MRPPETQPPPALSEARFRIADCFAGRDERGRLVQRRDSLNLAGLGLTAEEIEERFRVEERGLGEIGFGDLEHLRYLDLTSNKLERLPRGTERMPGLLWLGLNFNKIEKLTSGAGEWKELRRLYVRRNQLKTLPEAVASWTRLEELDLHGNANLTSLPHVWISAMDTWPKDNLKALVVELGETPLAADYAKAGKGELKRESIRKPEFRKWVLGRPHEVEARETVALSPTHEPAFDMLDWLNQRREENGLRQVSRALARLGLDDGWWFPLLEEPEIVLRTPMAQPTAKALVETTDRQQPDGAILAHESELWLAWHSTKLGRVVERDWQRRKSDGGRKGAGKASA